ncbi:MAG: hypothetical protein KGP27_04010 [Hyphomicrobiales bacterium]|nr:hypothetical protein [Hyphomicrobiales bacterium]
MSDLVVEPAAPPSPRRPPRRGARIVFNALRVVTLVTATFAALAGGIYFSSTSACKTPCRLDGSVSNRVAAVDTTRRGKVESAPEHNGASSAPQPPLPAQATPPSPVKGKEIPPPTPRRGDVETPPRPSVGMRTDLPRVEKPVSVNRWTNAVFREDTNR